MQDLQEEEDQGLSLEPESERASLNEAAPFPPLL